MGRIVVLLAMMSGCAAQPVGPDAQSQERALEIVWEGVFGMEQATRPIAIKWWPPEGCHEELDITGVSLADSCALDSEGSNGDIYIRWEGSIAVSNFSRALVIWRQYILTGVMTRPSSTDLDLVAMSNIALHGL